MKKTVLLSVATSSLVLAGAYKVPEQSVNSTALGAAYVAHTTGADTAYFNPANMAFMDDEQSFEAGKQDLHGLTYQATSMRGYKPTQLPRFMWLTINLK